MTPFQLMMTEAEERVKARRGVMLEGRHVSPEELFPQAAQSAQSAKKETIRISLPHLVKQGEATNGQSGPPARPKAGPSVDVVEHRRPQPWQVVMDSTESMVGVLANYLHRVESGEIKPSLPECDHLGHSLEQLSKCALQLALFLEGKRRKAPCS